MRARVAVCMRMRVNRICVAVHAVDRLYGARCISLALERLVSGAIVQVYIFSCVAIICIRLQRASKHVNK